MPADFDLHIHTNISDGSDSPEALALRIAGAGLQLCSVTDHDAIAGALQMERLLPAAVKFVRGVEFSCVSAAGKCHILGYGFDPKNADFLAALEEGRQLRRNKTLLRLQRLRLDHGVALTKEEADWLWSQKSPGKPHLGRILLNRGMGRDLNEAIQTYIPNVPGKDRIEAETAVKAILSAGGVPVWAHPLGGEGEKRLSAETFAELLELLLDCGIRGMECWYSRYDRTEIAFLLNQAEKHGLAVTGGSDYHGSNKQGIALGQLSSDASAPDSFPEALTSLLNMV